MSNNKRKTLKAIRVIRYFLFYRNKITKSLYFFENYYLFLKITIISSTDYIQEIRD